MFIFNQSRVISTTTRGNCQRKILKLLVRKGKLKFISNLFLTFDSLNSGETFVFCNYVSTQNKIANLNYPNYSNNSPTKTDTEKKMN